jgi:hypothetical protein
VSDGYWNVVDSRTDRLASAASWLSEDAVLRTIEGWKERDAKGGRPDVHDLIPFLEPRFVAWEEQDA